MSDADLKALYQFVKFLGASGTEMPVAVGPGGAVRTPVFNMNPQIPVATPGGAR